MLNYSEYLKLVTEVNRMRNEVNLFNNEEVSEAALDDLKHQITLFETEYPDKIAKDSPNYTVAGGVLEGFKKFTHVRRVLSLNDLFDLEEAKDWEKKWKDYLFSIQYQIEVKPIVEHIAPSYVLNETQKVTEQKQIFADSLNVEYIAEPKLDGMAFVLHYEQGHLFKAVTRGDSRVGEDVTANALLVQSIPKQIPDTRKIEIRGELIMSKKDFEKLNSDIIAGIKIGVMGKSGSEAIFANPRNAVAGTIRNLDQSIVSERPLNFIAYGLYINE
jgi:DNA ligase (NAD+)